jgi:UDP-3-O-[3-hydroxymyristoyl] N-acetylglucosamine deacetylase
VATVEHLFGALAGMGVYEGVGIDVVGPELPLLDGGAARHCEALDALEVEATAPRLVVARSGAVEVEGSRYDFEVAVEVAVAVEVQVQVDFEDERIARDASWRGDARAFRERIAPARTFGFAHEWESLLARGLATHVARESVVVVAPDAIHSAGRPFAADEPARHKLLDLMGDLYLHGGPPRGRVRATRPGHARTHEAVRRALESGLLVRAPQSG